VITPDGFPLAYEVLHGNTADATTLRGFLKRIEEDAYGKARRVWVMDHGIPSEAILEEMREPGRQTFYLVGTPKSRMRQNEQHWLGLPWQKVREQVEVKLYRHEGEVYGLAKSQGRQAKETAMRHRRLARLLRKLRAMRKSLPKRDQQLLRIGAAKKEAGRAFGFVEIQIPKADGTVRREMFRFELDKAKLKAAEQRDGRYLLRSNLTEEDPAALWVRYVQLTQIESVFRALKSELGIRPIYHQLELIARSRPGDSVSRPRSPCHTWIALPPMQMERNAVRALCLAGAEAARASQRPTDYRSQILGVDWLGDQTARVGHGEGRAQVRARAGGHVNDRHSQLLLDS
jgi:transposase